MEFLSNKPLLITDTILRDAHQSQAATRMTTADMLPALEICCAMRQTSVQSKVLWLRKKGMISAMSAA